MLQRDCGRIGLDVGVGAIRAALDQFRGVTGAFICATGGGVSVIDDYGHHPTESKRPGGGAGVRLRQSSCSLPTHRYTRTRDLIEEFTRHLAMPIRCSARYLCGERDAIEVGAEILAQRIGEMMARRRGVFGSFADAVGR